MSQQLVECVPNFSEGRVPATVDAIVRAMLAVRGVALLDRQSDADHNRSVITLAGPPDAVADAAFRGIEKAVELIDLTCHHGAHPRIGAADVVPFVPLQGVSIEDCVRLAERLGQRIWSRLKVPVYLYEAAARRPGRTNLENIRRGQFEALTREMGAVTERHPDIGDPVCHPTAGATVVGARKFLIAYNINLGTPDLAVARGIARAIRSSSGGFPCVKSMGMMLTSRNLAQVSINLTDFERTPLHLVFETVRREAARLGVEVVGSEIVGLIPAKALEMAAGHFLRCENFRPELVLENRIAATLPAPDPLPHLLDVLAAPGGNAVAALAAMAAALAIKVTRLAGLDSSPFEEDREFFTGAASGPPELIARCSALARRLERLRVPSEFAAGLAVATALSAAATAGLPDAYRGDPASECAI
jgi:glutamate formiminotransferase